MVRKTSLMKKNLPLLFFLSVIISCTQAQRIKADKVPSAITKDFQTKFPFAVKVKWKKAGSLYFAWFIQEGKGIDISYESDGTWIETLSEINVADLPEAVVTGAHNIISSATIKAAAKIEQPAKDTGYIVMLKFKGRNIRMTFDSKGIQTE